MSQILESLVFCYYVLNRSWFALIVRVHEPVPYYVLNRFFGLFEPKASAHPPYSGVEEGPDCFSVKKIRGPLCKI